MSKRMTRLVSTAALAAATAVVPLAGTASAASHGHEGGSYSHEGRGHEGRGHEGRGHEGRGHEGRGHEGRGHGGHFRHHHRFGYNNYAYLPLLLSGFFGTNSLFLL